MSLEITDVETYIVTEATKGDPEAFARAAERVVDDGYDALKFDPFDPTWFEEPCPPDHLDGLRESPRSHESRSPLANGAWGSRPSGICSTWPTST